MSALDEIRGRLESATPGPWHWSPNAFGDPSNGPDHHVIRSEDIKDSRSRFPIAQTDYDEMGFHDAEFIANAPADVAQLVADVQNVLNLHAPLTEGSDEPYCRHCYASPYGYAPYPCPTVQCITTALEAGR